MATKTTIYLPDELKRAVEREASLRGSSEAEVIRSAIEASVGRVARRSGIIEGEPIARRVDELLDGFGAR